MTGSFAWWNRLLRRERILPPKAPRVPDGTVVYAIGDIHGECALLRDLLDRIGEDIGRWGAGHAATVVFLGDYVDRGPDSRGVVDILTSDPLPGVALRFLRGNHEDALLHFLDDPESGRDWLRFGGAETLASYGLLASPGMADGAKLKPLAQAFLERLPEAHLAFLRATEPMLVLEDYVFVHAGIRPGIPLERQKAQDLMWIRDGFVDRTFAAPKVVVHGHTIVDTPEFLPHRIAIDTGAYATGVLTALALKGEDRKVLQTSFR